MIKMDIITERYIHKVARKEFWRVCSWYELDDLVQDGFMHYYRVANKYHRVRARPHIMRLFQITFWNHITDLANQRTGQVDCRAFDRPFGEAEYLDSPHNDPDFTNLQDAPKLVRDVIALHASDGGLRSLTAQYRRRPGGTRETTNERLCRLLNLDPETIDVPEFVRQYLSGNSLCFADYRWFTRRRT